MTDDNTSKEDSFAMITETDKQTAKFYLDMCKGNVGDAVEAYYNSTEGQAANDNAPSNNRSANNQPASSSSSSSAGGGRSLGSAGNVASASARPSASNASSSRGRGGRSRTLGMGGIATLASLGGSRDSDDEDESGKNYYAGGEKSGQMIQDPRGRGGSGEDGEDGGEGEEDTNDGLASKIFERARQRGPLTDSEREEFNETQRFTGAGYRLGQDESIQNQGPSRPDVIGRRNVTRTLTFYANGFTVDDGPLRRLDDPRNESFLRDINEGIVPHEMEGSGIGNVSINLVDKKHEDYVPPKPRLVPFSGGGQRLGSEDPGAASASGSGSRTGNVDASPPAPQVDESRPVATVQIRLSDGTRLKVRLNDDATIADLRNYVLSTRPNVTNFTLATTFPRKVLTDEETTLKEANLNGSVVVQTPC